MRRQGYLYRGGQMEFIIQQKHPTILINGVLKAISGDKISLMTRLIGC